MKEFLKKLKGSAARALGFEVIHIPVDVGTVFFLTGSFGTSIAFVAIQHFIVFCLHTVYDRVVYKSYYDGK